MKTKVIYLFTLLIIVLVYWPLIKFGPHFASDLAYLYPENLGNFLKPLSWNNAPGPDGFGFNNVATLWIYPTFLLFGVSSLLPITFDQAFSLFFTFVFLGISFFSIRHLAKVCGLTTQQAVLSGLIYLVNTYVLLIIDGGQLGISYAFALFPLCVAFFIEFISSKIKYTLLASLLVHGLISYFDLRVFILVVLTEFFYLLIADKAKSWKYFSLHMIVLGVFTIAIHIYWIVPLLIYPDISLNLPSLHDFKNLSFFKLENGLLFYQPHWPNNYFGKLSEVPPFFLLYPLLAFWVLITQKSSKNYFLGVVILLATFFTKGANPPFGVVNEWIFNYIPGFQLFRDPSKFFIVITMAYAILVPQSITLLEKKFIGKAKHIGLLLTFIFIGSHLLYTHHNLHGLLQQSELSQNYQEDYQQVLASSPNYRTLWAPLKPSQAFSDSEHPAITPTSIASESFIRYLNRGSYDTFNFIRDPLALSFLQKTSVAQIKFSPYLSDAPLKKSDLLHNKEILAVLDSLSGIEKQGEIGDITSFVLPNAQPKFTYTKNLFILDGGFDLYRKLYTLNPTFVQNNAFVFLKDLQKDDIQKLTKTASVYLITDENKDDVQLSLRTHNWYYDSLPTTEYGWGKTTVSALQWKTLLSDNLIGFDNYLDIKGDIYYSTIKGESVTFSNTNPTEELIAMRVLQSQKGGSISIKVGDGIKTIKTLTDDGFQWVIFPLPPKTGFKVINDQGFNAFGSVYLMASTSEDPKEFSALPILYLVESKNDLDPNYKKYFSIKREQLSSEYRFDFESSQSAELTSVSTFKEENGREIESPMISMKSKSVPVIPGRIYTISSQNFEGTVRIHYLLGNQIHDRDEVFLKKDINKQFRTPEWSSGLIIEPLFSQRIESQIKVTSFLENSLEELSLYCPLQVDCDGLLKERVSALRFNQKDPTKYNLDIAQKGIVVMSERFNKNWLMVSDSASSPSFKGESSLNFFALEKSGEYSVIFQPQHLVDRLIGLSVLVWVAIIIMYGYFRVREKHA